MVTTVVDARSVADVLAAAAVAGRLAACAQVGGQVDSTYWWRSGMETSTEWSVQFKTAPDRVDRAGGPDPRQPPVRGAGDPGDPGGERQPRLRGLGARAHPSLSTRTLGGARPGSHDGRVDEHRLPLPRLRRARRPDVGGAPAAAAADPVAAEVVRLDREIVALGRRGGAGPARRTSELAGTAGSTAPGGGGRSWPPAVRAGVGPAPPVPVARPAAVRRPRPPVRRPRRPAGGPAGVAPGARPETSTRTVQGLLFVLGGLLLGTAAVVFTAVAWAAVGVAGRALILVAFTVLALAVPLLAVRRGLRGTAETFAAVGLLLVVLDGYAAWSVDLFGVAGWPGTRYAALVGGAGAAVAAGVRAG